MTSTTVTIPRAEYERLRAEAEAARTFERHMHAVHERAERYREALEFYADPVSYLIQHIHADHGNRARRALEAGDE